MKQKGQPQESISNLSIGLIETALTLLQRQAPAHIQGEIAARMLVMKAFIDIAVNRYSIDTLHLMREAIDKLPLPPTQKPCTEYPTSPSIT